MTRKFLRGLSLWLAAPAGALLSYSVVELQYLESVARRRRQWPQRMICGTGHDEALFVITILGALLALFLVALFWRSYQRLPATEETPRRR